MVDAIALCCCVSATYKCVKRGYCYRLCSPSTASERAGLTDLTEMAAAPADAGRSFRADDEIIE